MCVSSVCVCVCVCMTTFFHCVLGVPDQVMHVQSIACAKFAAGSNDAISHACMCQVHAGEHAII